MGGRVVQRPTEQTSFVVCNLGKGDALPAAVARRVPLVRVSWLIECVLHKRLVSVDAHQSFRFKVYQE